MMKLRFSSLTTSLGKKLILPMFPLDTLVLLRANEAESWGASYVEVCQHLLLVIARVGHADGIGPLSMHVWLCP